MSTTLPKGFVGLFDVYNGYLSIKNLSTEVAQILIKGKNIELFSGQEIAVSSIGFLSAPRRRVKSIQLNEQLKVMLSEFSPLSVFTTEPLMLALLRSDLPEHRVLSAHVLKTAACISVVTANHGIYSSSKH